MLKTTLDIGGTITRGMAELKGKIYIVCVSVRAIIVFEAKSPYTRLPDIVVDKLIYAWDLAACNINDCIYVSDKVVHCVWRISIYGDVTMWIEGIQGEPTISMMKGGNVLTCNESKLNIYAPSGSMLTSINLPDELTEPLHAVSTIRQTFFVSHGTLCGIHRICEISKDGCILRTYGRENGRGIGQLDSPYYMATDEEGRLFVWDVNMRILLFDSELRLLRVLLSREDDRMDGGLRISYARDSGNLLIGTFMGKGGVGMYHIRNGMKQARLSCEQ